MNMQCRLIQELMLYKFEQDHKIIEATKNIYCGKCEGTVDLSTVTKWFKAFHSAWKELNDQTWSGRPKTVESKLQRQIWQCHACLVSLLGVVFDMGAKWLCFKQGAISILSSQLLKLINNFMYLGSSVLSTESDVDICLKKVWTAIDSILII